MKIESPILQHLYDYWRQKRGTRALPARRDLDPVEIPSILPNVILLDVVSETQRMRARVVGTKVVGWYGSDYTGKYLDEIDFGDQRDQVLSDYRACLSSAKPQLEFRQFRTDSDILIRMERVILPLSDDGETVNMLLSGLSFEEQPGQYRAGAVGGFSARL